MKTMIELPDALYRSASELAIAENTPLPELIASLVGKVLSEKSTDRRAEEDFVEWRGELL